MLPLQSNTYLFAYQKRGKDAIEIPQSILNHFHGCAIHDCWSSYFKFEQLKHGIYGAHMLRELQAQIENKRQLADQFKSLFKIIFHKN